MELPITTLLASALVLWLLILSANVIRQRGVAKVSLGDGGDESLIRKSRAQGNLVEYAPFMIIMVGLAEFQNANTAVTAGLAGLFFLSRLAHGYALSFSTHSPMGRGGGSLGTFISMAAMALFNIYLMLA